MSNVFISHSSADKTLVRRISLALLNEGIPVWLDSWKLELGDSLIDKIYESIDESSILILVVSLNAIKSGWVNRELNAALSKEQQIGRKFVVPVKIDECDLPLKIADRIYSDFSSNGKFSESLSTLVRMLSKQGCRDLIVNPERELLGLSFSQEVHLNFTSLQKAWSYLSKRQKNISLNAEQIVIDDDRDYELLLAKLHNHIDNMHSQPNYKPENEAYARQSLSRVEILQNQLKEGISILLMNGCSMNAVYWFAKILRGQMVYALWGAQHNSDPSIVEYGKKWKSSFLLSNTSAANFFEVEGVDSVDVWNRLGTPSEYFHLWMGKESCRGLRDSDGRYAGPMHFYDACGGDSADKYLFPQMVLGYLHSPSITGQPIWDLSFATIGIH